MKILLLGGTGVIGNQLTNHLCKNSLYKIDITSRKHKKKKHLSKNVSYIFGNAKSKTFLKDVIKKKQYDLIVDFMVYSSSEFKHRIDMILANCGHYFFLSSYRVFADIGSNPFSEETKKLIECNIDKTYLNSEEYAISKCKQELFMENSKFSNWTIVRPGITYGPNRLQLLCYEGYHFIPRTLKGLSVPFPVDALNITACMTSSHDCGYLLSRLIECPLIERESYNIASHEKHTWNQIIDIYKSSLNLEIKEIKLIEYLSLGLNNYQLRFDRLVNRICNNNKILKKIDEPNYQFIDLEFGINEAIKNSNFSRYNSFSRVDGRMDKIINSNQLKTINKFKQILPYIVGYNEILNRFFISINERKYSSN